MPVDPRDLTTVAAVQAYLPTNTTTSAMDAIIQGMVTAASLYWLERTGRDSLNSVGTYSERYDGNGGKRLFLRNAPLVSVTGLSIGALSFSPSPDYISSGYVIDQSKKSVSLIGGWYFRAGAQNVAIQYTAGYSAVPADVQAAVTQQVAVNFKRRGSIDQGAQIMPQAGGTNSYRSWEIPPEVERTIQNYTRRAMV